MPSSSKRPRASAVPESEVSTILSGLSERRGAPMRESIVGVKVLTTQGKGAVAAPRRFAIIRTNERDEYEEKKTAAKGAVAAAAKKPKSADNFEGTDRRAAKLSIGTGNVETFKDVKDLIASLPDESVMTKHKPPIQRGAKSGRVAEEQRNVVVDAFIYAASKENDNDFHLILGRDPKKAPERYMTMELSGLPPKDFPSFDALKTARDTYKDFFGEDLPGDRYDFYDPPIPVKIQGSLFFDITHSTGQRPGPKSLKSRMPVIWEVHPVTKIKFK